jgi:uncharacterized metal-binding protein YceD (DUF177 family)
MIAAAMTTRNPPVPMYTDLARSGATIRRDIVPRHCQRLTASVENLDSVNTELEFSVDQRLRMKVTGHAVAKLKMPCQLCMSSVAFELTASVEGVLASSESEAQTWRAEDEAQSIIVISGPELNELELVEDELLLRLPSQVCSDTECERRPVMTYGPDVPAQDTHRPFAALDELVRANKLNEKT